MSRDSRIDAYIERAQPFARPILTHVREHVHAVVPDALETLKWGAPAFTVDGKILLIMAAFKAHAALNFWRGQELGELGDGSGEAMGQFGRLTSVADLPRDDALGALIRAAATLCAAPPAPRNTREPKAAAGLHPQFASALDRAPAAKATFEAFPPSCRREYVEWIGSAKRDETRTKRIATAIDWLNEGKRHDWRYQKA